MRESTPRSSALTRLGHAVERAAAILFARSDARARAGGWQVSSTGRWNTARVYRDPRYDRLRTRVEPDRYRPDPVRTWADPRRAWIEPDRGLVDPGRGSVDPGRALVGPGRALVEPGRGSVEPGRALVDPGRAWSGQ